MYMYLVDRDVCDIADRIFGAHDVDDLHTAGQHLPGIVTRLPPLTTLHGNDHISRIQSHLPKE
jgi:hypothetical protein